MSIGLGARTPGGQHLDIVHSMAATWCLGPLSDSRPCPGPVLEAEYRGVANAVAESCWLRQLLHELGHGPWQSTVVFCLLRQC
jgi:hypothetical protein